tara:strand:+ start:171 stop:842 length:672 start_codon:yes stop_codon:yes gene_type:complete
MKVKILVPESLAEITLEQYQKFLKISEENENSVFLNQKMVEIFCNIPLKEVLNIKYKSIVKIVGHLNSLFEAKPKHITIFKKDNKEFGFIPKLDDMTFGEYVDVDTTIKEWSTIHKAMGVLYRPIISKVKNRYLIEEYNSYDNYDMKKMPLDVVFGAVVFFWSLGKELLQSMPNYLKKEMENLTCQQKQILEESGIGIQAYIDLVTEQLQTSIKLPNYPFINV